MARAFWKGSISFGLVEIGVTLKPASNPRDISFTLLDRNDFSPVGFKRYNKSTGREVPWERVVRGYEFEEDQYVVLTDEELRSANAEATQTIDLVEFVEKDEIPPIYFDSPYYVEPQRRSSKSYQLLLQSLEEAGLVAIARVVLRTRQHVAALYPHQGQLLLVTLRYENELRKPGQAEDGDENEKKSSRSARTSARHARGAAGKSSGTPPSPAEIKMATRLIQEMKAKWKPARFKDEYRDDVLAMVDRKVKSGKIHEIVTEAPERPAREPRDVVDLMPLLKKSLEGRTGRGESKGGRAAEGRASKAAESRDGARAATRTRSHSPRHAEPRRRRA